MKTSPNKEAVSDAAATFLRAGWPPLLVFLVHLISLRMRIYVSIPEFDMVMHYAGGIAIAWFFHTLHAAACSRELVSRFHPLTHIVLVLALTCTAAMFWEFGEFLSDRFLHSRHQVDLSDTMLDMFLGLVGGITLVILHPFNAPRLSRVRASAVPLHAK